MKQIALYGYGKCGKYMADSFLHFWDGEYRVTAVFDRDRAGEEDEFRRLTILPPERLAEEYRRGTFEAVMISIMTHEIREEVTAWLESLGVPVFFPGDEADFADAGAFAQEADPEITVRRKGYGFHVYKNIRGAVSDLDRRAVFFLFNEEGKINIDNNKKYLHYFRPYLLSYPFRLRDPIPEKVYLEGDWCLMTKTYNQNYGHFTLEIADGIYLMEEAGYRGKYIYAKAPFAEEIFRLLGVSPDRLVPVTALENHKVYVFERLYDINHDGLGSMEYSEEVLPEMARVIRRQLPRDDSYPKRLYVRRIGSRKLLNAEEIAEEHGFRIMVPEEHSLREQMTLFYNADIVLCPHGANSTNFIYMHEGAVFAEIFSDRWYMPVNRGVCRACGVHYLELTGTACGDAKDSDMTADYTVDEEAFRRLIRKAEGLVNS